MQKIKSYYEKVVNFLNVHSLVIIIIITIISTSIATIWSYQHGYIYAYNDAKSHLNIARRVIDNLTPGIAQLGGSWLPLYHILMFPLIWNNFFWHSGIAGSYISFITYVLSAVLLFKSIYLITKTKFAAFLGTLLFIFNVNALYLSTAAMGEMSTVFFIVLSVYLFIRWQNEKKLYLLISLGLSCFLGTLDRYEMWAIAGSAVLAIILSRITFKKIKSLNVSQLESEIIIFCTLGFFGMVLWLLWNLAIFGDAFSFMHGIYSAGAYQTSYIEQHLNLPYKNILQACLFYFYDSGNVNTWSVTVLGIIGSIYYLVKNKSLKAMALVGLSSSVVFFEVYCMYSGNTSIYVPQLYPYDYYNIRYGIYALPFVILFASYALGMKNKIFPLLLFLILFAETILSFRTMPITLLDSTFSNGPVMGNKLIFENELEKAATYMHTHYDGGLILTSAGVNDGSIFLSNLDIKDFITEGNQKYWTESLQNPRKYATWVMMRHDDSTEIRNTLIEHFSGGGLFKNYKFKLLYSNSVINIYKKE